MKRNTIRALCFSLALCLCLALFVTATPRAAAETPIKKVLVQTGNGGTPPVVWLELQYFPTNTSTQGAYISFAQWYYYADSSPVVGRFKDRSVVYLVVEVSASPGYMFPDDVMCFINGSEASSTKLSDTCVRLVSHTYTPEVWAAAVYKDPTGETVDPGGWASFVVSGGYVQDYQWCIRTPDKRHWYTLDEAKSEATVVNDPHVPKDFLQVTWSGEDTDRLVLSNIPADFDGYYVFCRLSSYDQISWTNSGDAKITVNQPTPPPTPEPTPEPTPSPTPSPTPTPRPTSPPRPTPTPRPSSTPAPSPAPATDPTPAPSLRPLPSIFPSSAQISPAPTEEDAPLPVPESSPEAEAEPSGEPVAPIETGEATPEAFDAPDEAPEAEPSAAPAEAPAPVPEKAAGEAEGGQQTPAAPQPTASAFDPSLGIEPEAFRYFVLGVLSATGAGLVVLVIAGIIKRVSRKR